MSAFISFENVKKTYHMGEIDIHALDDVSFEIQNAEQDTILELPYLYYLGYEANIQTIEGKVINVKTFESENGFVAIKLPENIENATVNIKYEGTAIEKAGYIISVVTVILCIAYVIKNRRD